MQGFARPNRSEDPRRHRHPFRRCAQRIVNQWPATSDQDLPSWVKQVRWATLGMLLGVVDCHKSDLDGDAHSCNDADTAPSPHALLVECWVDALEGIPGCNSCDSVPHRHCDQDDEVGRYWVAHPDTTKSDRMP